MKAITVADNSPSNTPKKPERTALDAAKTAGVYTGTTIGTSPFIALAMLAKSLRINEGVPFTAAVTNPINISRSLDPRVWGLAAARRTGTALTVGESVRLASEQFESISPLEKAVLYSFVSAFIGSTEAYLTTRAEAAQVILSRGNNLPKSKELTKTTKAALPWSALRNSLPVASLFTAKELVKHLQEQNGGKPINDGVATAIGICFGAIAGAISLPADVAANIAIKTGEKPTFADVWKKGPFTGGCARAMQQGINVGSLMIAGLIINEINKQTEEAPLIKKPTPTQKHITMEIRKSWGTNMFASMVARQEREGGSWPPI